MKGLSAFAIFLRVIVLSAIVTLHAQGCPFRGRWQQHFVTACMCGLTGSELSGITHPAMPIIDFTAAAVAAWHLSYVNHEDCQTCATYPMHKVTMRSAIVAAFILLVLSLYSLFHSIAMSL
jgi:hypothetical protein